jgi:hypothetical protein
MSHVRIILAAAVAVSTLASTQAISQVDAGQCILAGRISSDQRWAPRFAGVQMLGAHGQVIASADKKLISAVSQVRITQPALLSKCDGSQEITRVPDSEPPIAKTPAPALSAGVVDVESVAYPKLRTGGELVELKVRVPAQRVVMLTR